MEKLIKVIDTVNEISFVVFEFFTGNEYSYSVCN